jgi:hypothetical protein
MFLGHFGAGFAAKSIDQQPSLGTLFLAAQWTDLIWPVLLLAGIEKVNIDPGNTAFTPLDFVYYPFSHGFLSVVIWGSLIGGIYYLIKKNARGALLLAGLVLSHWILDWLVHGPDLPLVPGSDIKSGLGLWNSIGATILVEGSIFFGGVYLYFRSTHPENRKGQIGLWSLLIFFIVIYVMNLFGPPPPSAEPVAYVGLAQWLFVGWAYWIDANRKPAKTRNV